MTAKVYDSKNRWRNLIVAFRVSPEESAAINRMVGLSGMTKQEYLISRVLCKDITVLPNPRVYKHLRTIMQDILKRLEELKLAPDDELQETIRIVAGALDNMKGNTGEKDA